MRKNAGCCLLAHYVSSITENSNQRTYQLWIFKKEYNARPKESPKKKKNDNSLKKGERNMNICMYELYN